MAIPALIGGLGALGAGALGMWSTAKANQANREMVQKQMDFQRMMSSTAYQRAMQDMRKAGLNPILAYSQGGATTPTGSTAKIEPEVAHGVSSAMQAARLQSEVRQIQAQTELVKTQDVLQKLQLPEAQARAALFGNFGSLAKGVQILSHPIEALVALLTRLILRR